MRISKRARIAVASISTAAVLGGGALAYAGTASAAGGSGTTPATPSATATPPAPPAGAPDGPGRPGGPGGPGAEKPLTGETKTKVEDAVKAKYPDATIERTETDAGGVYEAHIVTKAGTHLVVKVGKDFTITGTETPPAPPAGGPGGPGRGGPGRPGGPGAEKPLTGETKTKVEDAVKAKYPDATIERTETDAGGVYEAHIVTKDGTHLVVKVGKDFTITGTETPPAPPKGAKPPTPPAGAPTPPAPAAPSASSSASPSSTIAG